jgi:uncharacterized protein YukE
MKALNPQKALENNLRLIELQLSRIDQEIEQRKQLSKQILAELKRRLEKYNEIAWHREKRSEYAKDMEKFNKLVRETQDQLLSEEVSCWSHIQRLLWEKRQLEREKARLELNLKLIKGETTG